MHLRVVSARAWRWMGILAVGAMSVAAVVLTGDTVPVAHAAGSGIQYDEVTKFVGQNSNPQPGTFGADFQAAVSAGQQQAAATNNAQQHHGLFSMIHNAVEMAKNVGNTLKSGTASTEYYLGALHRVDDPGAQTATIDRPDLHQIIYLDLAKKTYRVVDTSVSGVPPQAPPPTAPQNPQQTMPPEQPGTGKLDVSVSNTVLGPKTIEGVATTGYSMSFKSTMSKSTGSCRDGGFQTSMTEYLSSYPEPGYTAATHRSGGAAAVSHPETFGMAIGCKPSVSYHKSGGGSAPGGRLSMWTLLGLGGNVQSQGGTSAPGFRTLIERGNVRALGGQDKGLFDVPAGFTKVVATPTP